MQTSKINSRSRRVWFDFLAIAFLISIMGAVAVVAVLIWYPGHVYAVVLETTVDRRSEVDRIVDAAKQLCAKRLFTTPEEIEVSILPIPGSGEFDVSIAVWKRVPLYEKQAFLRKIDTMRHLLKSLDNKEVGNDPATPPKNE